MEVASCSRISRVIFHCHSSCFSNTCLILLGLPFRQNTEKDLAQVAKVPTHAQHQKMLESMLLNIVGQQHKCPVDLFLDRSQSISWDPATPSRASVHASCAFTDSKLADLRCGDLSNSEPIGQTTSCEDPCLMSQKCPSWKKSQKGIYEEFCQITSPTFKAFHPSMKSSDPSQKSGTSSQHVMTIFTVMSQVSGGHRY